ncbi:MAG: C39 family peptidase [Candidatus Liptonbacteria bacterium]|nr:C39 family peptidase [Candidatus Liptonbacteria bacterium]
MPYIAILLDFLIGASIAVSSVPINAEAAPITTATIFLANSAPLRTVTPTAAVPDVPFYSQFRDISATGWQKLGCGIASLAMIINFYRPGTVSVDKLLKEGIAAGAYLKNAGWKHRDLALLAGRYGLEGESYDLSRLGMKTAFGRFEETLKNGPAIASVYYKFDPKSTIPHLVVITGVKDGRVYYNDPAGLAGGKEISVADFMKGWKKRFITIEEPAQKIPLAAM